MNKGKNDQTDEQTKVPCVLQDIVPFGAAAQKQKYRRALNVNEQPTLLSQNSMEIINISYFQVNWKMNARWGRAEFLDAFFFLFL